MNELSITAFGEEMDQLAGEVSRLGGLAESQMADCLDAVVRDLKLDALQAEIERKAISLIALHQPDGRPLRRTVAALKIAMNLERCGDLARNIAKRGLILFDDHPILPLMRSIERMGQLVEGRLKAVLDAYAALDLDGAISVWQRDHEVDEHYNALFAELIACMMSDPRAVTAGAHLMFIAKNLERIGDHATNVAEFIHFEITGEELAYDRPKQDAPGRLP